MNNVGFVQTRLQRLIGTTLRCGVIAASLTGVLGGIVFLAAQGGQSVSFHLFEGAQSQYASPFSVMHQAFAPIAGGLSARGLAITQLGIMMLLLTPIIRVALSIVGFALEHDRIYVTITSIVLVTLIGSLMLH